MSVGETLNTISDNALDNGDMYYSVPHYLKANLEDDQFAFRNELFTPPSDELFQRDGSFPPLPLTLQDNVLNRVPGDTYVKHETVMPVNRTPDVANVHDRNIGARNGLPTSLPTSLLSRNNQTPLAHVNIETQSADSIYQPPFSVDLDMVRRTMVGINSILGVKLGGAEVGPSSLLDLPNEDSKEAVAKSEMSHFRVICDACGYIIVSVGRAVLAAAADVIRENAPANAANFRPKPPLRKRRAGILGFKELALRAGLSPWHFHRVFRYITGVTPKIYGEALWEYLMIEANFDLDNEDLLLVNYMNKDANANASRGNSNNGSQANGSNNKTNIPNTINANPNSSSIHNDNNGNHNDGKPISNIINGTTNTSNGGSNANVNAPSSSPIIPAKSVNSNGGSVSPINRRSPKLAGVESPPRSESLSGDRAAPLAGSVPAGRVRKTSSLSRGASSRSRTRTHTHARAVSLSTFALENNGDQKVARGRSFSSHNRRPRVLSNHDDDPRRKLSFNIDARLQPSDLFEISKGTETFQDTPVEETPDVAALSLQQQLKGDAPFDMQFFNGVGQGYGYDRDLAREFEDFTQQSQQTQQTHQQSRQQSQQSQMPQQQQQLQQQQQHTGSPHAQATPLSIQQQAVAQPIHIDDPTRANGLDFEIEFASRPPPLGSFDELARDAFYNYDKPISRGQPSASSVPSLPSVMATRSSIHENLQRELLNDTFQDDLTLNVLDELPTSFYSNTDDKGGFDVLNSHEELALNTAPGLMAWHEPTDTLNYPY